MSEYSVFDLRDMSASEAKELPEEEYARWRSVQETVEDAQATQARWRQQEREVGNVLLKSANDELHIPVDMYGNEVLVHAEVDMDIIRQMMDLQERFGDRNTAELSDAEMDALDSALADVFTSLVVEFNGTPIEESVSYTRTERLLGRLSPWHDTPDGATVLYEQCRDDWRFSGMWKFVLRAYQAVQSHQQEWEEQAKSFRRQERARDLRNP